MALAREYRGLLKLHHLPLTVCRLIDPCFTPFWVPNAPMPLPRSLRPRRTKPPGSPVPFDPECCYLYVDGSYDPAAEDSPEKCGWGLHVVRARFVLGQFCGPIVCGLLRENTRVFKLSNKLGEMVAHVHTLEFVLSQPSSLNFMICFDFMCAAHVVQLAGDQPLASGPICW